MKEKEVWKDIPGYPDYQISSLGGVKSLQHTVFHSPSRRFPNGRQVTYKEKILVPAIEGGGYYFVVLYKDKVKRSYRIHRLVAQMFLNNPNNYDQVNHKDEDKLNNCVDNLEWCDAKYNVNYGTGKYRKTLSRRIPVLQFTLDGVFIREHDSATEAAYSLGLKQFYARDILRACSGRYKTVKNFIWKFKNNN